MKKFLFVIAALATCMTANAKYWFSGSFYYNSTSYYTTDSKDHQFEFSPSVGLEIEDNLSVAAEIGLIDSKANGQKITQFYFAPYLRWEFFREGDFSLFLDGGFNYAVTSPAGFDFWEFSLFAQPGIRYDLSEHFALATLFNGLTWNHESEPGIAGYPGGNYKNGFALGADTWNLKFSLIYEF